MFENNLERFYSGQGKLKQNVSSPPEKDELEQFWNGIYKDWKEHNKEAEWIRNREEEKKQHLEEIPPVIIDVENIRQQLAKMENLKSPGPDGIPNFWLKQFDALHVPDAQAFNELIQEDQEMDEWLAEGHTFLIPKSEANPTTSQIPANNLSTNNIQTFNRNCHWNIVPPSNTTRRPKGRTEGM